MSETTGGQGLREVIARELHHDWHPDEEWGEIPESVLGYYRRLADVTLAVPEIAALIADAERVRRVRELLERRIRGQRCISTDALDGALDGDQ